MKAAYITDPGPPDSVIGPYDQVGRRKIQRGTVELAEPGRAEPNPEWADAPPTEYEEPSPTNPDWVEESEAPPIGTQKRNASEFYDLRYANRSLTMPRGMMRGTFDTVLGRRPDDGQPFGATGTISTMNFGVGITLADDFEIGFSRYRTGSFPGVSVFPNFGFGGEGLITFSMSPQAKFGDIPFYARFEAFDGGVHSHDQAVVE